MLASYEYLGLLGHDELNRAASEAIDQYGTGHHGSRLLTGTTSIHRELEARLADWMEADDAIVFSSGYVANLATISALVGPGDYVVGDKLNHASIVDGCRMSGAEFAEFKHNDMDDLTSLLLESGGRRTLVVVDAIFSMEGDIIDLPAVVEICKKHSALLMVDEAHSMGVLGKTGGGIQEHFGLAARRRRHQDGHALQIAGRKRRFRRRQQPDYHVFAAPCPRLYFQRCLAGGLRQRGNRRARRVAA